MSESIVTLPVSVEQIAAAIKRMAPEERQHLFDLVPDLRRMAAQPPARTASQAQKAITRLQEEVLAILDNQPLSPDEPFLGDLTIGQYNALSDEEKAGLWDKWAGTAQVEEREVSPDALLAG